MFAMHAELDSDSGEHYMIFFEHLRLCLKGDIVIELEVFEPDPDGTNRVHFVGRKGCEELFCLQVPLPD